jgi:multisubunit Na+/H+ antiporter MnhE subunit
MAVSAYWFTAINRSEGLTAYPILLFAIPFLWQIIKPNTRLNFTLGMVFICLSSYLILAFLSDLFNLFTFTIITKNFIIYGGLFVVTNFIMALWIIRNSFKKPI